jgi:acyl carrier protein
MYPDEALDVLGRVMNDGRAYTFVMPLDWQRYRASQGAHAVFSEAQGTNARPDDLRQRLQEEPISERSRILAKAIADMMAPLGSGEIFPLETPVMDSGLDSAALVELRAGLSAALGVELSDTVIFERGSIGELAELLVAHFFTDEARADDRNAPLHLTPEKLSPENDAARLLEALGMESERP